jgi:hypothetical protein
VPDDHGFDAGDDADAGHHAGPDGQPGPPRGQRGQLEERAVRVDEQLDALADQQLAALAVPLLVTFPAAGDGQLELGGQLVEHGDLRGAVRAVGLVAGVDVGDQDRHAVSSRSA